MADNKITVGLELQDDLSPKLNEIKSKLSSMPKEMPGGGGFMAEQMKELTAGIGYQIGAWSLGYMIADQITKAIGGTVSNALSKEFEVVKFENLTHGISGVNDLLTQTKQIADATNQSFKDITEQRFKLEQAGVPYGRQGQPLEIIGKMAAVSGESADRLADMVGHIKEGTADEREMLHIAALISPEMEKQLQALRDREVEMPKILRQMEQEERSLERQKMLRDREYEDRMRRLNRFMEMGEKTGVADVAFREAYRSVDASPDAQAKARYDAAYETRGRFQAQFKAGQEQIRKELGYSYTTMDEMVKSGLIGQKELLEAAGRVEDDRQRNSNRAFEDQRYSNQMKAEGLALDKDQTKLSILQQERDALFDQVKAQQTLNELTEKFNKEQGTVQGSAQGVAREMQSAQEDAGSMAKSAGEAFKQPWERPRLPEHPSPRDTERWLDYKMQQVPGAKGPGDHGAPATEKTLQHNVKVLEEVAKNLAIIFSGG